MKIPLVKILVSKIDYKVLLEILIFKRLWGHYTFRLMYYQIRNINDKWQQISADLDAYRRNMTLLKNSAS